MKANSSLTMRIIKWVGISLAVILMAAVITAYLSVEFYLQRSYRNLAEGRYRQAALDSTLALGIGNLLYSGASKHLQDIYIYDVKVWSKLGVLKGADGEEVDNIVVNKMLKFERRHEKNMTPQDMARLHIASAQIANATIHGSGVDALVYGIAKGKRPSTEVLMQYAKEEIAYKDTVGFYATLHPKTSKDAELNDSVLVETQKEHDAAQASICKHDVRQCRFNALRWKIGLCIRRAYLGYEPCSPDNLRDVTSLPIACSSDLLIDDCYTVSNDLQPYYHHLLQAQAMHAK